MRHAFTQNRAFDSHWHQESLFAAEVPLGPALELDNPPVHLL